MVDMLHRIESESRKFELKINTQKTKIMIIDRSQLLRLTSALDNLETVEEFVYLGSLITNNGTCETEIRRRIAMGKSAASRLTGIWRSRTISRTTKVRLMRALVFAVFFYGAETWTIKTSDRKKIDFEMWSWRRLLRVSWTAHRTNEFISPRTEDQDQALGCVPEENLAVLWTYCKATRR